MQQWAGGHEQSIWPGNRDSTCSEDLVESPRRPGSVRTSLTTEEAKARDRTSTRHGGVAAEVEVKATTDRYMNVRSAHMFICDCHFGSWRGARTKEPIPVMIPMTLIPTVLQTLPTLRPS